MGNRLATQKSDSRSLSSPLSDFWGDRMKPCLTWNSYYKLKNTLLPHGLHEISEKRPLASYLINTLFHHKTWNVMPLWLISNHYILWHRSTFEICEFHNLNHTIIYTVSKVTNSNAICEPWTHSLSEAVFCLVFHCPSFYPLVGYKVYQ